MSNKRYIKVLNEEDNLQDVADLVRCAMLDASYPTEHMFDLDKADDFVKSFLTPNDNQVFIILFEGTDPIGMFIGMITKDHPYLKDNIASEVVWYVRPDKRKGRGALILFDAFEYWASQHKDCKLVSVSSQAADTAPSLHKLYGKKGYKVSEITYIKEV